MDGNTTIEVVEKEVRDELKKLKNNEYKRLSVAKQRRAVGNLHPT